MKILGQDGQHYINIGPSHTTEVGKLLNLATESWFTTPHGRCLTLAAYHHFNSIRWLLETSGWKDQHIAKLPQLMNKLMCSPHGNVKQVYKDCMDAIKCHKIDIAIAIDYPSDWQTPALYARLSMLSNPIDAFYLSTLPIVWLDAEGNDLSDTRKGIGRYIETILKLRNDHGKHIQMGIL